VAAGVFAIVAGLGEIIVGVEGNYIGILSKPLEPSAVTALVGACYCLGGVFILTLRKWGVALGMASPPRSSGGSILWQRVLRPTPALTRSRSQLARPSRSR
jgi:hypothetical protein